MDDITMEYTTLNNGVKMPLIGYGVFRIDDAECERCVSEALACGYRLIDTAAAYGNEAAVGRAIRKSGIDRKDLFIVTKLKRNGSDPMTEEAFERSLEELGLDYVDLYLIHQPYGNTFGCYDALERIQETGRTRAIGVSNFNNALLTDIIVNHTICPAVNQIEISPVNQREKEISFMKREGVQPMAWGPLSQGGKGNLFQNAVLLELGEKYGKTVAQIALRWHIQRKVVAIPKSTHRERMLENLDVFDFQLSEQDMQRISGIELGNMDDVHEDTDFIKMICGKWNLKGG